ncbi:MAG: ABC transporter permease [Paenibacillus sp.]|nr:ABC transporter permease [Paenibacillus sp.]
MISDIAIIPYAPESNRNRFLHNTWTTIVQTEKKQFSSNGPMSYDTFKSLFLPLSTPEAVTAYAKVFDESILQEREGTPVGVTYKKVDDAYWKVFDFTFVAGRPFDKAEADAGMALAVITANTARAVFGSTDVVGREILLNYAPYRVVGVVKDVPSQSARTFAHVFVPILAENKYEWNSGIMGDISVTILAHDRSDFDKIREEFNRRVESFNKEIASTGWEVQTLGRPYDQELESHVSSSNLEPDIATARRKNLIIYAILLLVPAINLSSMTESRLRGRIAEIGVRRAFGCTRFETMMTILGENLVVTIVAGAIGLLLSVVFAYFAQDYIFSMRTVGSVPGVGLPLVSMLNWTTFFQAFVFCFILNLLSTGIPAWKASRMNIVNAISGLRK